jgi:recombination protein RecT
MTNAVATRPQGRMTIRDRLNSPAQLAEIAKALPSHCKPERMARVALTALNRTPKLANCTEASFFECLLSLSQWGLEPDGRRAHLIPYGDKCTLVIDFKGYVELAYRSGVAKNIHASVVCTGDVFAYKLGKVVDHTPWDFRLDDAKPAERGEVIAAYCIVEMTGGAQHHEVMTKAEVELIRKRSKAGNNGPWVTDWNEMAKKTVFRRASKWIPMSAEIRDALDRDDDRFDGIQNAPRGVLSKAPPIDLSAGEAAEDVLEGDVELTPAEQFAACETSAQVKELRERLGAAAATDSEATDIDVLATEAEVRLKAAKKQGELVK